MNKAFKLFLIVLTIFVISFFWIIGADAVDIVPGTFSKIIVCGLLACISILLIINCIEGVTGKDIFK